MQDSFSSGQVVKFSKESRLKRGIARQSDTVVLDVILDDGLQAVAVDDLLLAIDGFGAGHPDDL